MDIKDGALGTVLLPLGMAVGTIVIPWISDKFFAENRLPMVIICAGVSGVTVFTFMKVEPGFAAGALLLLQDSSSMRSTVWFGHMLQTLAEEHSQEPLQECWIASHTLEHPYRPFISEAFSLTAVTGL